MHTDSKRTSGRICRKIHGAPCHFESQKYGLEADGSRCTLEELQSMYNHLAKGFDRKRGGMDRAPKIPSAQYLPVYARYYKSPGINRLWSQVKLTLDQMAFGGIYDR